MCRWSCYEVGDLSEQQDHRGSGSIDITGHDAPDDLNARRMVFVLTGDGLTGEGSSLDVDADVSWVIGCP